MTAEDLVKKLLSSGLDLSTIPVLYIETVDGKSYISQATEGEIQLIKDVQDLPDSFDVILNTQVDVGVLIGTFPKID